ncbi:hypothetical protein AMTRI_Chr06g170860 [Amborella trichopoda]
MLRWVSRISYFQSIRLRKPGFNSSLYSCKSNEDLQNVDLPLPLPKAQRKPYPTPMKVLIQRAKQEKEERKANHFRVLPPPDNGLLVPELVPMAYEVYGARLKLLDGLSKLVNGVVPVKRCRFCHEVHIGSIGYEIRTCTGPKSGFRSHTHVWRKGRIEDVVGFPHCFHLYDRAGRPRVVHDERFKVQRLPAIVELCIQAGLDLEDYPTRRRTRPVYIADGRVLDFEPFQDNNLQTHDSLSYSRPPHEHGAENSRKLNWEKRLQLPSGESLQCNDPTNNSPTNELLCHTSLTPELEENSSSLKGSKSYLGDNSEIHDSFVRNHLPPDFRKETLREFSENERLKPSSAHGFQLESRVFASENVQDVRELNILSCESGEEDVRELSTKTMNSWFKMREGAKKLMKKYSVKTCGYCLEVQVGPKGHKVRMCKAFKHQQRNGQHAWQEATMEDLIFPKYVWHVADPNGPPLSNVLKRFYGKAPAIVELCVQAGAPVPEEFRGMMRLDVVSPGMDEADLVS